MIVFADESLSLIEVKQRASGRPNLAVDFGGTDFAAVGRSLGGRGADVTNRDQLESALQEALPAPVFSVISCRLPRQAYDGRI